MIRVALKIHRYNPEVSPDPWWQEFEVDAEPTDRVLDVLHEIKWNQDGTLTLRRSCGHGICGSDAMVINGRTLLACKVTIEDVGPDLVIEPIRGLDVIKDLVVDMEPFFEGMKAVSPWLENDEPPPRSERRQSPEEVERYAQGTKCIQCAACTTSCPIFWTDDTYIGPAAIVVAHRFVFDSRDDAAATRLETLASESGVFKCRTVFNCTDACPRGIPVTELIGELKRTVLYGKI